MSGGQADAGLSHRWRDTQNVDAESFFAIVLVAALAAITVAVVPRRFAPPVVVIELFLGIVVGPQVLGLAETDSFIDFFSSLGPRMRSKSIS